MINTKNILNIVLSTFLLHLLSGCETTAGIKSSSTSSSDLNKAIVATGVRKIKPLKHYPPEVAGFRRGQTIAYESGLSNVSTGYHILTKGTKIIATIYEYSRENKNISFKNQYQIEQYNIKKFHQTAKVLSSEPLVLKKNGRIYSAYRAKIKYGGNFLGRVQRLYSEIILIDMDNGRLVKLRSTAPITQKAMASNKNMQLLKTLNWAY